MVEHPVHFLIVDDLEENLLSMEALLRRDGLVILKARSGAQALELLLVHDVALALLDVQMPEMDGFELAELMRGTERTKQVPIIFLTAGADDYQRRFRGYGAGAVDFLHKPVETDILKSKAGVFFDLYRQRQALQEADRRKDEFLATLAHELRNPLVPIRNGLTLLPAPEHDATAREVKQMMERQLVHLIRLIDDLLDVSRISQGKIELKKENTTLQAALQAALESSRPLVDAGQHTLSLKVPDAPIPMEGDPTRLAQILSNLLNNAAKYTPTGGKIEVSVTHDADSATVTVADNGIGISRQMQSRIFDLFTQAESGIEHSQGGLGIGLALVKQLVSMHGGTISVQSEGAGKGSTFSLRLPASAQAGNSGDQQTPEATAATAPTRRILVVDDNIESAKTTGWMLEMMGHVYYLAHDGEEALTAAKKYLPEVILLDIGLPRINGYEVCRTLRRDPRFRNTVFIAQTGWGQQKDRDEARAAGFDHHLVKPLDFQKFSELIADLPQRTNSLSA